MSDILGRLRSLRQEGRKAFSVLIDPDEVPLKDVALLGKVLSNSKPFCVLMGGSLVGLPDFDTWVRELRASVGCPVVLFPGHISQLSGEADAILFLSLISGRNPELLIGQHVHAAPQLHRLGLEVIPTGYLLFTTGVPTAAQYMSQTQPLPMHKPELAAYTALAGCYLGLQVLYLDAGSGADQPIPVEVVRAVRSLVDVPIIVGGGIRTAAHAEALLAAGADMFVVGTALESAQHNGQLPAQVAAFAALTQ